MIYDRVTPDEQILHLMVAYIRAKPGPQPRQCAAVAIGRVNTGAADLENLVRDRLQAIDAKFAFGVHALDHARSPRRKDAIGADHFVEYFIDHEQNTFPRPVVLDNPGFLVLQLGDREAEYTVDQAARAIHGSLQSLFASCGVRVDFEIRRTPEELAAFMAYARDLYSHIVLIGHGDKDGLKFRSISIDTPNDESEAERRARRNIVSAQRIVDLLGCDLGCRDVEILSLCCHSGCDEMGAALSAAKNVSSVIAPVKEVSMQWAAHFVTDYFLRVFVNDEHTDDAVPAAVLACSNQSTATPTNYVPMRVWRNGQLICDPCAMTTAEPLTS